MSVLVFQHTLDEDAATLGQALSLRGHRLHVVRLYAGDAVPPDLDDVDGILSMGGPMNVDEAHQHPWITDELRYLKAAHEAGVPIVGVCLGEQFIAAALGGKVEAMPGPEVGWLNVQLAFPGTTDPIFAGIGWDTVQFHLHGQHVSQLPPGATLLASSKACKVQAFKVGQTTYGFQYHFEWDLKALEVVAGDGLVAKAGSSAQALMQQAQDHYAAYRRLGDRLIENIATTLFATSRK